MFSSAFREQSHVSGEQKASEEKKEANYQYQEFSYGRFERAITLPEGVDTEKLTAEYKTGFWKLPHR